MTPPPVPPAAIEAVTLDNCDREPIHLPGSIQPHGALVGVDRRGHVSHLSANVAELLGFALRLGQPVLAVELGGDDGLHQLILQAVAEAGHDDLLPVAHEVVVRGRSFDLVIHAHGGVVLCEFEHRARSNDDVASFAQKAYRSMDGLRRQPTIEKLLEVAVSGVRAMTGFDRVMAYRFRHDDSGEVVAEARLESLDAYVGRRYPASDIPAQARRLYVLNTLRLIADVGYMPVPVLAHGAGSAPLDLSHSVLRSVSPIHVEYLRNMGVAASMSVSIVIGGRLWGMIACHHMSPLQVPFSIRMAADVMAQLIGSAIQSLTFQAREAEMLRAARMRTDIASRIAQGHETVDALDSEAPALLDSLASHALLISLDGLHRLHGTVDPAWATALVHVLERHPEPLVHLVDGAELPPAGEAAAPFCGALGLCFDRARQGWLVALRHEQVQTIRWGGKPEKHIQPGPLGPRLTPRGSFDEWREVVRGKAEPWNATALESASLLLDALGRSHSARVLEIDRLRSQMWAVLGHDLRDPLQSLSMATHVMDRDGSSGRMFRVIRNSTNRMQRMLSDLQDITRVQNGLALATQVDAADLALLVRHLLDDAQVAYPTAVITARMPDALMARVDASRYIQVVSNLLSNARHHGDGPTTLLLESEGDHAVLTVSNAAPPIPDDLVPGLFDPFKRQAKPNPRNPGSMGLGLYIAHQVMLAHRGSLAYRADDGHVTFVARLPLVP